MNRYLIIAVATITALTCAACSRTAQRTGSVEAPAIREPAGSAKALVVYYSRTGATRRVAEELARQLGADLERIQDVRGRSGIFGFARSGREAIQRHLPEIREPALDPGQYQLVVLGTPVWAGTMSSPMRTYITRNRDRLRQVAFFCTQGGENTGRTFAEMAEVCGRSAAATLSLRRETVLKGAAGPPIGDFADRLRPLSE
jgi:flavodoxin